MKIEERLTHRVGDSIVLTQDDMDFILYMDEQVYEALNKIVGSLCRYEDTGLSPAEITDREKMFTAYRHACGGLSPEEIEQLREKQIPKTPIDIDRSNEAMHVGDCPHCGQAVDNTEMHCDRCGQALKWAD